MRISVCEEKVGFGARGVWRMVWRKVWVSAVGACHSSNWRVSIVVSIPPCHGGDPGSIPGRVDFLHVQRGILSWCFFPLIFVGARDSHLARESNVTLFARTAVYQKHEPHTI